MISEEAPTIIDPPEALTYSAEGRPVNITCGTTGKPDPIVTWYKDDQLITGGRYRTLSSGSLNIGVSFQISTSVLCKIYRMRKRLYADQFLIRSIQ